MTAETTKADELLLADSENNDSSDSLVLVCSMFEDQRPLTGTVGALDWRLRGFLSRFVKAGRIEGRQNEVVYIPFKHHNTIRHLVLVGLGKHQTAENSGEEFSGELLKKLAATISNMKFKRVAISRSSFPFLSEARVKKALDGINVEFTQ